VTRERSGRGWSLEILHHKLYVTNPPEELQYFSISHGLNFVTLQRSWPLSSFQVRAGFGIVLAHPESSVRGRVLDENDGLLGKGYYFAGPVGSIAVARRIPLWGVASAVLEARGSVAPVSVPVADGDARTTATAFHLLLGAAGFL
jgi:hypothetical protein